MILWVVTLEPKFGDRLHQNYCLRWLERAGRPRLIEKEEGEWLSGKFFTGQSVASGMKFKRKRDLKMARVRNRKTKK